MTTISHAHGTKGRSGFSTSDAQVQERLLADAHELGESLSDFIRVVQFRDRDRVCCYDVSVSQWYALKAIADSGPLTVNELAGELFLDKSAASRLAAGLVAKGYVSRERDASDGRIVRLGATSAGHDLRRLVADDLARQYAEILADISPGVRIAIADVISQLARSFAARVDTTGGSCCVIDAGNGSAGTA